MPPKNIDKLKTLQPTKFPKKVGAYTLTRASEDSLGGATATYVDKPNYLGFTAVVEYGAHYYRTRVQSMDDPVYRGNVVCGTSDGSMKVCVMAGTGEALVVRNSDKTTTPEQIATYTQLLYDGL